MSFVVAGRSSSASSVSGPGPGASTSTDNAIVRWDGTTGTTVQDSAVTIADTSGAMTFTAASGADVTWSTDGAGTIGGAIANRPDRLNLKSRLDINPSAATVNYPGTINVVSNSDSVFPIISLENSNASGLLSFVLARSVSGGQFGQILYDSPSLSDAFAGDDLFLVNGTSSGHIGIINQNAAKSIKFLIGGITQASRKMVLDSNATLYAADLRWSTDGGGNIGTSSNNRPSQVYVKDYIKHRVGDAGVAAIVGGTVKLDTTQTGNAAAAGDQSLLSYTTTPGFLQHDKEYLDFEFGGTLAATANTKQLKIKFAGTTIVDGGAVAINSGSWRIFGKIFRIDANNVKCIVTISTDSALLTTKSKYTAIAALDLDANSYTLLATGASGASAASDIVNEFMLVKWYNDETN